ncbi:MAG: PIN domain-containing protein [Actinomycetales bacterium]|nr:PIN domain-containing protein [Actinomycetales bacterium]
MPLVVLYDANVLYPSTLRDVLIRVGLARLVQPKWTEQILDEMFLALRMNRPDLDTERLDRTRELMNASIRDVAVRGYGHRIEAVNLPDPDDRHVLAAAIHAGAHVIVTKNLRDFPANDVAPWGVSVRHPDTFLTELHTRHPDTLRAIMSAIAHAWGSVDATPDQVIDRLAVDAPGAAGRIRASLHRGSGPESAT